MAQEAARALSLARPEALVIAKPTRDAPTPYVVRPTRLPAYPFTGLRAYGLSAF